MPPPLPCWPSLPAWSSGADAKFLEKPRIFHKVRGFLRTRGPLDWVLSNTCPSRGNRDTLYVRTMAEKIVPEPSSGELLAKYLATNMEFQTLGVELLLRMTDAGVILTAPHTKATLREGVYKRRDENTGVLAMEAGRQAGVSVLIPTTPGDFDGNWDVSSLFRRTLVQVGADKVVVDVHGMRDDHGVDLVVGTAGNTSPSWLVQGAVDAATDFGWSVEVRHTGPLSASERTICALANNALSGGIQLEIAARWRSPRRDPSSFTKAVDVVAAIARAALTGVKSGNP